MTIKDDDHQIEVKCIGFFDKGFGKELIVFLQSRNFVYVGSTGKDNTTILRFIKVI